MILAQQKHRQSGRNDGDRAGDPNDEERWGEKEAGNNINNEGNDHDYVIGDKKTMKK
jgi:hypothetical protein